MATPCAPCGSKGLTTPTGGSVCQPGPRGPRGDAGETGDQGSDGQSAYTLTQQSFNMPTAGASVTVQVANASWIGNGQILYLEGAGFFSASSPVSDPTLPNSITLTNLGYGPNVAAGTLVGSPAVLSPGGPKGASAPDDTLGYMLLVAEKPKNTNSGTFPEDIWTVRPALVRQVDTKGQVALITGGFRLKAGKYKFRAQGPAYNVRAHRSRIKNITKGNFFYGSSEYAGVNTQTVSVVVGQMDLDVDCDFAFEARCSSAQADNGFGVKANFDAPEIYGFVEITEVN